MHVDGYFGYNYLLDSPETSLIQYSEPLGQDSGETRDIILIYTEVN